MKNVNNVEEDSKTPKKTLNKIIELKSMNATSEDAKDEDTENLLFSDEIKNIDMNINLQPKSNLELFKKYFPIVITTFSFLLSYYLYYLSLEPCFGGFDTCVFKKAWIKSKVLEAIFSVLINTILFELMLFKKINKLHLVHFFIAYFFLYKYSHGYDFDDHGLFNFLCSFFLLFIILLILCPMNGFIYLYKKKKKKYLIIYIIILISFIIFCIIISNVYMSCSDWPKGLNNTYIENDINKYSCQIKIPVYCSYHFGQYFLDLTKLQGIKCSDRHGNEKEKLLKFSSSPYVNKNTKKIGYPITNKDSIYFKSGVNFETQVYQNLVDMDNEEEIKKHYGNNIPEVYTDFSVNKDGEMFIDLHYNETLSKEKKKLENNSNPYANNIMVLYLDSLSRANSIRKLKKVMQFFEYFTPYKGKSNQNYPSEIFYSFQFFKYYTFQGETVTNYPRMFYGAAGEIKNKTRISKYLNENGYVTGYANDHCYFDNIPTNHDLLQEEAYDHQMTLCDPNLGHYCSMTIRCIYGKGNWEHLYNYGNQFWRKYKDNRKYLQIVSNDPHENTLEPVKYMDEAISDFLWKLFNDNLLINTTIIFISDHGAALPSVYHLSDFYYLEHELPMLFMVVNYRKNKTFEEQYEFINENQQNFITCLDVYDTILHLVYGDEYLTFKDKNEDNNSIRAKSGKSLFTKIDPKSRSPKMYDGMDDRSCK